MFCSFTLALSVVYVRCPVWLVLQFFNSVIYRYVTQVLCEWIWNGSSHPYSYRYHFCFHIPRAVISIMRSLYLKIFSASFLATFRSIGIATSINVQVSFSLSRIMIFILLLGIVLSVCTCWFHDMFTVPSWLVSTDFGTWSYQCSLSNFTPISLRMLQRSWTHTL